MKSATCDSQSLDLEMHALNEEIPVTILLVEDSRFLRTINERALSKAGYKVITAADGEEGLLISTTRVPDLIVLDMLLPKLSGPEVLRALRKNPITSAIPVIVLTSLAQKNETKLRLEGAMAYFEKSKLDLEKHPEFLVEAVTKTLGNTPPACSEAICETQKQ
jgi:two-component system, cell cycle response regulator DivK